MSTATRSRQIRVVAAAPWYCCSYDAKRFGVTPLPGTTMVLQERAYTSPIWYTPN